VEVQLEELAQAMAVLLLLVSSVPWPCLFCKKNADMTGKIFMIL
jgi:hypothetical protein